MPNDVRALLESLIRRPSVTPEDAGCQQLIAERLGALGFRCEPMNFGNVSNLWARLGSGSPLVCFAGHTDVVPPGPAHDWQSDPFVPVERGGMLFGRGAADMKGGLAAMVVAVESFLAAGGPTNGSLAFLITSDEEGPAVDGTRKVVETLQQRGVLIDYCVVGEPSSNRKLGDVIRVGRRGSLTGRLRLRGEQGHVAYPEQIDNPIAKFAAALAELCDTRWDAGNEDFSPTSFQIVSLESGHGAVNVTPPDLRATFNFRYSTEQTPTSLKTLVQDLLARHSCPAVIEWEDSGIPFVTKQGRLTDAVSAAVYDITGIEGELSTGGGTSDGRFIAPTGAEVVELGPVNASIHKVDEHVRIDDIDSLVRIYRRILELLLNG